MINKGGGIRENEFVAMNIFNFNSDYPLLAEASQMLSPLLAEASEAREVDKLGHQDASLSHLRSPSRFCGASERLSALSLWKDDPPFGSAFNICLNKLWRSVQQPSCALRPRHFESLNETPQASNLKNIAFGSILFNFSR